MELDGFFSAISDGFILTDLVGNVIYMNPAASCLLSAPENYKGRAFTDMCNLINVNTGEPFHAPIDEALKNMKSMGLAKNIGIIKNKKIIYLSATVSPVIQKGETIGVSLFLRDVTHLRELEIKVEKEKERAEEASRIKGEFLANMSHEIRTPINGFIGMVDLTLRSHLTTPQRDNLLSAKTCANDLLQIINDILDYSKLENNKMQVELLNTDLHDLLSGVERVHSRIAAQKGLLFVKADRTNLPQYVKGDPLRLRQILNNLLTNALKFTEEGAVAISVRLRNRGEFNCARTLESVAEPYKPALANAQKVIEFAVLDSGLGISSENRQKLFKPFSQVDGSTTRKFGGTGLGLRIVKELVALMGGVVKVSSVPNLGSCFYFFIPYIEVDLNEAATTPVKPAKRVFDTKDVPRLLAMCKERLMSK